MSHAVKRFWLHTNSVNALVDFTKPLWAGESNANTILEHLERELRPAVLLAVITGDMDSFEKVLLSFFNCQRNDCESKELTPPSCSTDLPACKKIKSSTGIAVPIMNTQVHENMQHSVHQNGSPIPPDILQNLLHGNGVVGDEDRGIVEDDDDDFESTTPQPPRKRLKLSAARDTDSSSCDSTSDSARGASRKTVSTAAKFGFKSLRKVDNEECPKLYTVTELLRNNDAPTQIANGEGRINTGIISCLLTPWYICLY
jgi:hypothetical protein